MLRSVLERVVGARATEEGGEHAALKVDARDFAIVKVE